MNAEPRGREVQSQAMTPSRVRDCSIAVSQSVPAFLLQTPGGTPPLRRKSLNATCFLESVETGPVVHRPVPFLGQLVVRSCSVRNKRIGFAITNEMK